MINCIITFRDGSFIFYNNDVKYMSFCLGSFEKNAIKKAYDGDYFTEKNQRMFFCLFFEGMDSNKLLYKESKK